jgi:hypothetical protein
VIAAGTWVWSGACQILDSIVTSIVDVVGLPAEAEEGEFQRASDRALAIQTTSNRSFTQRNAECGIQFGSDINMLGS